MQTFTYKFDPSINQTAMAWQVDANLFVYESGVASVDGANRAVIVKPDNGSEITLKPGQRFRLAPGADARTWAVRLADPTVTLTANFILGLGEFEDSNTLNTFKLDGTFTNSVYVNNTPAQRVPVQLDSATPINVAGSTVNYTNSYAASSYVPGTTVTVLTPAQNPNGCYVEYAEISGIVDTANTYATAALIAKTSAPGSDFDGDVLMTTFCGGPFASGNGQVGQVNDRLPVRIKVAAGKGLYIVIGGSATLSWYVCRQTVLMTVL